MEIKPLRSDLEKYLKKRNLTKKYEKQSRLFTNNPRYPSLHTEVLEPKHLKIYSFRIDRKYRNKEQVPNATEVRNNCKLYLDKDGLAEIVDINLHYN